MRIPSPTLGYTLQTDCSIRRIISLNSGYTEALFSMGLGNRLVGVSAYCSRYCDTAGLPAAGDYLTADTGLIKELKPDLILTTAGVQLPLARRLQAEHLPVHALPLAGTIWSLCDAWVQLASLCGEAQEGRNFADTFIASLQKLREGWGRTPVSLYAELWFGSHQRTAGSQTHIQDLLRYAGADPLFASEPWAYETPDLEAVKAKRPKVFLGFSEPEYPVDFTALAEQRGWAEEFSPQIISSGITRGQNIIHDGPSLLETARWLQDRLRG
jgi:iron complex transport system substrate-binding protein